MRQVDLLVLLDREVQALTDENNHSAAALMREAAGTIRTLRQACGMDRDDVPDCDAVSRLSALGPGGLWGPEPK